MSDKPFMGLITFKGDIPVLIDVGSISHKKAKTEYKKYQVKTISPVEKEYLKVLKEISGEIEKEDKWIKK